MAYLVRLFCIIQSLPVYMLNLLVLISLNVGRTVACLIYLHNFPCLYVTVLIVNVTIVSHHCLEFGVSFVDSLTAVLSYL